MDFQKISENFGLFFRPTKLVSRILLTQDKDLVLTKILQANCKNGKFKKKARNLLLST